MLCTIVRGQEIKDSSTIDGAIGNLNLSIINGKVLYERSYGYARLDSFNLPQFDTADATYFKQANLDVYHASQQTQGLNFLTLESRINFYPTTDIVDVGILHTNFYKLNYDGDNPANSGLTFTGGQFYPVAGKDAFINKDVMVVSTLNNSLRSSSGDIKLKFADNLFLNYSPITISSLRVDFGNGVQQTVVQNNQIVNYNLTYNYTTTGYKTLAFTTSFANGTSLTTYCRIYIQVGYTPVYGARQIVSDFHFDASIYGNSNIKFQGYSETTKSFGQFDYRIFYHTNNNNTSKTLLRPIIIGDGFDPGDKRKIQETDYINPKEFMENRSIEEMMKYQDKSGNTINLIDKLTDMVFDVIIVNYPTYNNEFGVTIDGGADYIERNGRTMVEFMKKINADLIANNSYEKIVTVGPSMSGQIFRYALAFAEKYVFDHPTEIAYKHNCRLFISDDSPQQGATIPMGVQAFTYLASQTGDAGAKDLYYKSLLSVAAKQQLIEIFDKDLPLSQTLNGKTIAQGYTADLGHPFHTKYYTNLYNNGLANSHGYPMQCRKIAVANGSLTGQFFGADGAVALDTKGTINLLGKSIEAFHFVINNLPAFGTGSKQIAYLHARKEDFPYSFHNIDPFLCPNINTRGNLDILPGGAKTVFSDIEKTANQKNLAIRLPAIYFLGLIPHVPYFFNQIVNFHFNFEHTTSVNQENGCFIAAYSALGIKNPDQNWGLPLNNRNLLCANNASEIYFDSYYGEATNTTHTTFSANCIDWLFKELGDPAKGILPVSQYPVYPIDGNIAISGVDKICSPNVNYTFSFNFPACKFPSPYTWNVTPNLTVVQNNGNNIVVSSNSTNNEIGRITINFLDGRIVEKEILLNAPPFNPQIISYATSPANTPTAWRFEAADYPNATYQWYKYNGATSTLPYTPNKFNTSFIGTNSSIFDIPVPCDIKYYMCYKVSNACGSSGFSEVKVTDKGYCKPVRGGNTTYDHPIRMPHKFMRIQVATNTTEWFGHLFYDKESLTDEMVMAVNVYNKDGNLVLQSTSPNSTSKQIDMDVSDLSAGTYIFEIIGKNDFKELHTVYYSELDQEGYLLEDIATGNVAINTDRAADRLYVLQQKLFDDLQSDEAAMESSPALQEFAAINGTRSFGRNYQIQAALAADDITTATSLLARWQTDNSIDNNFKDYYQFYIATVNNIDLTTEQMTRLHDIAMACPLTDGEIVYAARDLYHYLSEGTDDFTNACASIGLRTIKPTETPKTITNYIYPNPSKGNITIDNLEYGTKTITITNVYGKVVQQLTTRNKTAVIGIKTGNGMYFINITNAQTGKSQIQKVVIE